MNVYNLSTKDLQLVHNVPETQEFLKTVLYAVMFSKDLKLHPETSVASIEYSSLNMGLDFSLTNIDLPSVALRQLLYDSSCQDVREYVDRPYPVKGNLVAVLQTYNASTPKGSPKKDLDNYTSFPVAVINALGKEAQAQLYVGVSNSTKTDFYTPFEDCIAVYFENPNPRKTTAAIAQLL